MRLIDADALMEKYQKTTVWDSWVEINSAPTIDPESLREHGKWIGCCECSVCHNEVWCDGYYWETPSDFTYCPNCGAKMDLEE